MRGRRKCRMHGGGTPGREKKGKRKRPGRAVTHGVYSQCERRSLGDRLDEPRGGGGDEPSRAVSEMRWLGLLEVLPFRRERQLVWRAREKVASELLQAAGKGPY